MNKDKWKMLLKLSGDYGYTYGTTTTSDNHSSLAFKFFKELDIDKPEKKFLDVGCGTGVDYSLKADWYGCDICAKGTDRLKQADAHELPYFNFSFDIVYSSHVLEHTLSPYICLLEMNRVLKSDGDLVLGLPYSPNFLCLGHLYVLDIAGWKHLLKMTGFNVIKEATAKGCLMLHCRKRQK